MAWLAVLACSERTVFENEGDLCLRAASGGGLEVIVQFPTCLSSSCDRVVSSACTVIRSGSEIIIRSRAVVETEGYSCTDDCGFLGAECRLLALEPGLYSVIHGGLRGTIRFPFESSMTPASNAGFDCEVPAPPPEADAG